MNELENLLKSIRELDDHECRSPFPYADSRALHQVFRDEFDQLGPKASFNADLNLFCSTIHGWTSGGIRKDLADAGARYRARDWLSKSFFDRFPRYRFLAGYDLSDYPALRHEMDVAERLRQMLLVAIRLYENNVSRDESL